MSASTSFLCLLWMANAATLAAARERRSQLLANSQTKGLAMPTKSPTASPAVTVSSDLADPLDFPDSPTPIAPPSDDDDLPSSIPLPLATWSNSERKPESVISDDGSDSIAFPIKKKRVRRAKSKADSEEPEEVVCKPSKKKSGPKPKVKAAAKVKAKAKAAQKQRAPASDSESVEMVEKEKPAPPPIVLMVPEAGSEGSQRLSIQSMTSFEDTLELIHKTIGCVGVTQKPTLGYKLSTAIQKSAVINLRTDKDWGGLVMDVKAKIKTKKDLSVVVSVFPDNYMLSLHVMTKKKSAAPAKKKGKMTIMDLNNNDSAGEDDDDEGVADGERKAIAELDAEYRKCMRCGPTFVCKIDRSGEHVHLSFNQRRAWAVSLACGTNNVTKTTPPQGELFSMFHRKPKDGPNVGPTGPPAPYHPYYPYLMPPLFGGLPPNFSGYHSHPPTAQYIPSGPSIHPMLSSDPPDDDVSYPSIIDFIAALIRAVPQREGLRAVGETLDSLHFFQINEIISLTVDELGTVRFGTVVPGDAAYLLEKVRREVK